VTVSRDSRNLPLEREGAGIMTVSGRDSLSDRFTIPGAAVPPEARISPSGEQLAPGAVSVCKRGVPGGGEGSQRAGRRHRRRAKTMGRYPFVCAYRRYLRGARARLQESTLAERERKLHFQSKVILDLHGKGIIGTMNPSSFTEDDIIEIFLAFKGRGIACETLRKHLTMLKFVMRECGNRRLDDMLAKGKIVVGSERKEPFSFPREELETLLRISGEIGGWDGAVCRFAIAMLTFLRLRPGELRKASVKDMDINRWTFFVANPKGKGRYGEAKHLPIPDVLMPYVLEYLERRREHLQARSIADAEPLIPAISSKGVRHYSEQGFGRVKRRLIAKSGISFKWKDFRPSGGQLALDSGVSIEQVSLSMRHASTLTTERYYCRARADLAFARVNDAYNRIFEREPAIGAK